MLNAARLFYSSIIIFRNNPQAHVSHLGTSHSNGEIDTTIRELRFLLQKNFLKLMSRYEKFIYILGNFVEK
jgi:hypothetical protein